VFPRELTGKHLTTEELVKHAHEVGGGSWTFEQAPTFRKWARKSASGHTIQDCKQGPFPLLCRTDGTPAVLADRHRVAIVQIKPDTQGAGRARKGAEWLFRLVEPLIDPDLVASQLRINQLGGWVLFNPESKQLEIGALYRDPQTNEWRFDRTLEDAEVLRIDLDSVRANIVRRSGGAWQPPSLDANKIQAELVKQLGGAGLAMDS
jgi:hypothetical protein